MSVRAEILTTGNPQVKGASLIINAPAGDIFNLLANPRQHSLIDGSHTVKSLHFGPERLSLGAKFGMNMKVGISYRITNTVVEFEEEKKIAWRHLGRWVWRYELTSITPDQTLVVETFDARPSHLKWWLKLRKSYGYAEIATAKTLVHLKKITEEKSGQR